MPTERESMAEALALAAIALEDDVGGPFGAVLLEDGRIVGRGRNRVVGDNDPTAHAEIVAIRDACRRLGRFTLEDTTLVATCEPCPMCLGAILWARIERVVFGAESDVAARAGFADRVFHEEVSRPSGAHTIPMVHLPTPEVERLMLQWSAREGRRRY